MKKGLITVVVLAVIAILFGMRLIGTYNTLVRTDEGVKKAWAQVENVYQRRADLIPNLVETVRGYAAHEKDTLQAVIEARSKATQVTLSPEITENPALLNQFQQNQGALSSALSRLLVTVEKYPDLKANEQFMNLQNQLEGTENRISVERMRYNEAAQDYNTYRRRFPTNMIANLFGFGEKAYFKSDAGADKVPAVKFN